MPAARLAGASAIALAVAFNAPYALLAVTFDYPQVLRRPPGEVLQLFADGGAPLILIWQAFTLSALALVPLSAALGLSPERLAKRPALAIGAAIAGGLAGLAQAIGLSRWVFAVPALAALQADPTTRPAAEQAFALLNGWGGVGIGEHLGQLLTALFALNLALLQRAEHQPRTAGLGFVAAALIALGTGEGLAIALGADGGPFGLATIAGFLALSAWLVATGIALLRTAAPSFAKDRT